MNTPRVIKSTAVLLFAAEMLLFIRWIPDDSFISFRYAENFAAGHGLAFNAGEKVEGFSNLLWTLFLGVAAKLGAKTIATALIASIICALASIWFSLGLFDVVLVGSGDGPAERRRFLGIKSALGLGLIASLPMIFYATSCLETHAELLFLLLGVTLHLKAEIRHRAGLHFLSSFAFLAVALLRPEGVSFLLLNAAFLLFRRRPLRPRSSVFAALVPVALYAVVLVLKVGYYDSVVPNTYLAKPGLSPSYLDPALRGVFYLVRFFTVSGLVVLLPFCVLALTGKKTRYASVYLTAVVFTQLAFIVFVGGDVLRFDRFAVPFMPFLLALALVGFARLDSFSKIRSWRLSTRTAWVCVALMVLLNGERVHRALEKYCVHDWMHARVHRRIGLLLADLLPADASVVVNEVGAISYYSGLKSIDMIGLTDAAVGRIIYESYKRFGTSGSEWSTPKISESLFSRNPTCVIVPACGEIDPERFDPTGGSMHPIWSGVYTHPALAERYRCVFSVCIHDSKYLYFFFAKNVECDAAPLASLPSTACMKLRTY